MKTTILEAAAALEQALDELACALVTLSPEPVMRAEETLATAMSLLATIHRGPADHAGDVRAAVARVRASVQRCEALGQPAGALSRALSPHATYGPNGSQLALAAAPRRRMSVT